MLTTATDTHNGAWGWSTWLPSGEAIHEAAVGALRDVQELKDSLQQALAIDDTASEKNAEPTASTQQRSPEEQLSQERKAVLDRLEGEDNPLAAGLKAVDDHVGLLAEGVAGLAGTLWGGARTASTHVAVQVESSLKELEEFSSECARLCNRVRATLDAEACSRMDEELTALAPTFEIKEEEVGSRRESDEHVPIAKGHSKILEFSRKGCARAEKLGEGGSASMAEIQSAAALALARLATLCIERLLALGRSLLAYARSRCSAEDGIDWPLNNSAASAEMLRIEVVQLMLGIGDLAHAYEAALTQAAARAQGVNAYAAELTDSSGAQEQNTQSGPEVTNRENEKSGAMEAEAAKEENEAKEDIAGPTENSAAQSPVGGCCSEAIAELKESFHGLLYVVLLSAQPPADLPIVNP
ncbi:hypothetical protein WJX75_008467 [Coccomyxa subellipsoidea]|uniref:Uncharacterized protein n=1 Tax=Coccomyxa subellipsoidea TaxID=248742 RepID=A0ABR2YIC4_9CHLO